MSVSFDELDKLKEDFIKENRRYLDEYKENVVHRFVLFIRRSGGKD